MLADLQQCFPHRPQIMLIATDTMDCVIMTLFPQGHATLYLKNEVSQLDIEEYQAIFRLYMKDKH